MPTTLKAPHDADFASRPLVVWRIHDRKPGHANQTRGLLAALGELTAVASFDLPAPQPLESWRSWLAGTFLPGKHPPRPDLILGAGHRTHVAVLAARRAYGGRAVVLMRPSLPSSWFDLCIIPEHDQPPAAPHVIPTRGVLNAVVPSSTQQPDQGLLLVGGPAAANGWDNASMLAQIRSITQSDRRIRWTLTTSRRTPAGFAQLAQALHADNLAVVPHEQTDADWLPRQLATAAQTWVSADSVSMTYESLTSGSAVGLLSVPRKRPGRVSRGMQQLWEAGWVTRFEDWDQASRLARAPEPLCESRRCARLLLERLSLRQAA